ncbi:hypothetical protein LJK88_46055 [Paenibacillus sp. P26]|nr:hypothetical protein LJK88_46055 [Paenibacillus sp. P26]
MDRPAQRERLYRFADPACDRIAADSGGKDRRRSGGGGSGQGAVAPEDEGDARRLTESLSVRMGVSFPPAETAYLAELLDAARRQDLSSLPGTIWRCRRRFEHSSGMCSLRWVSISARTDPCGTGYSII